MLEGLVVDFAEGEKFEAGFGLRLPQGSKKDPKVWIHVEPGRVGATFRAVTFRRASRPSSRFRVNPVCCAKGQGGSTGNWAGIEDDREQHLSSLKFRRVFRAADIQFLVSSHRDVASLLPLRRVRPHDRRSLSTRSSSVRRKFSRPIANTSAPRTTRASEACRAATLAANPPNRLSRRRL